MRATLLATIVAFFSAVPCLSQGYPYREGHITSRIQSENSSEVSHGIVARAPMPFAISLIADFESWASDAYDDASHYCTIGFGHLIAKSPCASSSMPLSKYQRPLDPVEGQVLLSKDAAFASRTIGTAINVKLSDNQFGALTSFVFNVGADNFMHSTLRDYINDGAFDAAARQFSRWVKSKNMVLDGLVARRACEAALFRGDIPVHNSAEFHRQTCMNLGAAPDSQDLVDIDTGER